MERRDFIQELLSKATQKVGLGDFFKTELLWNETELDNRLVADDMLLEDLKSRYVVRTGEAVTVRGEPFGSALTDVFVLERPDPMGDLKKTSIIACCAHADDGISVVETADGKHLISSFLNCRLSPQTPIAVWNDQVEELGVFGVSHFLGRENGYVRALEKSGDVLEFNSESGVYFRKRTAEVFAPAVPWVHLPNGDRFLVRLAPSRKFAVVGIVTGSGESFISVLAR